MRPSLALVLVALTSCTERTFPEYLPDIDWGDEPTDTFPQFMGRVPKNLVMISMDTFRRDHLDRYGEPGTSPFLTTLAESGVVLDDLIQCSNWTFAATSCTLAGRYNWEAGFAPVLSREARGPWPEDTPFLAKHLQQAGFYSILSSTNGWLSPEWGNTQGYNQAFHPRNASLWGAYQEARARLADVRAKGLGDRFFLHIHLVEPHASYAPPPEYLEGIEDLPPVPHDLADREMHYDLRDEWGALGETERANIEAHLRLRYRGEIKWVDDEVFRVFKDLEIDDFLDDTLLVVWTDHGEAFWEHGYHTHAYTLHREENDAIGFFWSKNIVPASVEAPVSAIDITPTLLELYGLDQPPEVTGVPISRATEDRARFAWAVARLGSTQSIVQDDWKMIFSWTGSIRLYDLENDPLEQTNLYDPLNPHPEARALWPELERAVLAAQALYPEQPVFWPAELRN